MDVDSVAIWVAARKVEIVKELNVVEIIKNTYKKMNPHILENHFLRLYGGINSAELQLPRWGFDINHLGKLSNTMFTENQIPPLGDIGESNWKMPYDQCKFSGGTGRTLRVAKALLVPIWMHWRGADTPPKYRVLVPTQNVDSPTIIEALQNIVTNGFLHEYISSELHLSTLVLDIDLKCVEVTDAEELTYEMIAKDSIKVVNDVLKNVLSSSGIGDVLYFIFRSSPIEGKSSNKYGLHHNVCFPSPVVLTLFAGGQLIKLFELGRHVYSKTIGRYCGSSDSNVYDAAAYGEKRSGEPHGHGLRLPFSVKPGGGGLLTCVHRTDGVDLEALIPVERLFAHRPHMDPESNLPIGRGRVIEYFWNIEPRLDAEYMTLLEHGVVETFVNGTCAHSMKGIMQALNKRVILFDWTNANFPQNCDVLLLCKMINELWETSGRRLFRAHILAVTNHAGRHYDTHRINEIINASYFVVDAQSRCSLTSTVGAIPCPNHVHSDETKKVNVCCVRRIDDTFRVEN